MVTAKLGKEEDDYPFVYFIVRDKKHLIVMVMNMERYIL